MTEMPLQRPYDSFQDYGTPPEVLHAVKRRFNLTEFAIDLAASRENTVAQRFYSIEENSLLQSWDIPGYAWLNPQFGNIAPFIQKAAETKTGDEYYMECPKCGDRYPLPSNFICIGKCFAGLNSPVLKRKTTLGVHILVLIPASVGANWWRDYVHGRAEVLFMNGRIRFVGQKDQYPKDCALVHYGGEPSYDVWNWRAE